ncbi:hypothetical protein N8H22_00185 [Stutzerimonas stutzeri]|uniref:DUF6957 family protein n=1 Tax=Stutzerimonas sp. S1 TaxID=3030652 RepID=UPI002224902A|nr:hypothetical protein [Stutzerimonas sp. S1]MCW3147019.1 hypothetical protein [Stutzerimonas sp. S1]
MDDLKKVSHLLYAPGEVMPGIEMSLAEAHARGSAAALHDEVPFCVVRDWIWIDLIVPDAIRETLQASGQQPAMVYAGRVLYDSANRFQEGDWVRTTQLIEFADGCIFRTRNTRYVLAGPGACKSAELTTVLKIF